MKKLLWAMVIVSITLIFVVSSSVEQESTQTIIIPCSLDCVDEPKVEYEPLMVIKERVDE